MSVTVVGHVRVNEDQQVALAKYLDIVRELLDRFGAEVLHRYRFEHEVNGEITGEMVVILRYPDLGAVHALFATPEYATAKAYRDQAFSYFRLSIIA